MSLKDDIATVKAGPAKTKPAKTNGKVVSKVEITAELFAHALVRHQLNATAAYKELKPHVTDQTAATEGKKYLRKPQTIAVLTPLLEKLFIDAGIETEYVFRRWLEIAAGSAADYFTFDTGRPVLDMTDMTPSERANLKSITVNQTKYGENIKIEVYDAQKAVDTIGKHLGLLVEKLADDDIERIGDMIEKGVNRIREARDLDAWKDVILGVEYSEVK